MATADATLSTSATTDEKARSTSSSTASAVGLPKGSIVTWMPSSRSSFPLLWWSSQAAGRRGSTGSGLLHRSGSIRKVRTRGSSAAIRSITAFQRRRYSS